MHSRISFVLPLFLACSAVAIPYKNGSVGFTLDLPASAAVAATNVSPPSCLITGGKSIDTWHLRLDRGANPELLSPKEVVLLLKNRHSGSKNSVELQNQAIQLGGVNGHWLLIKETMQDEDTLFGWLVLPLHGNQYLVANLLTTERGWATHGQAINKLIASVTPLDPVALIAERLNSIEHSSTLLNSFSKATLRPLIGIDQWRAIKQWDAPNNEYKDIGYLHLVVWEGKSSAIEDFNAKSDADEGIIVSIQTRMVTNETSGIVVDTLAQYWMSFDGQNERWRQQTKRWMDTAHLLESETGILLPAKLGQPKTKLRVFKENLTSKTIEDPFEIEIQKPWLPRTLHWIMGEVLYLSDSKRFFWKTFDNSSGNQMLTRIDDVTQLENNNTVISTSFGEQGVVLVTTLDATGTFVSQTQQGGLFIESSSQSELKPIWEERNLW